MIFTLNFHEFFDTMYKCVLNSVVQISMMFAKYFEYYTILLRGPFFRGHAENFKIKYLEVFEFRRFVLHLVI